MRPLSSDFERCVNYFLCNKSGNISIYFLSVDLSFDRERAGSATVGRPVGCKYDSQPTNQSTNQSILACILVCYTSFREACNLPLLVCCLLALRRCFQNESIEMNFIRKHTLELQAKGVERPSARLFSNPAGDFGSMVNERVSLVHWRFISPYPLPPRAWI